MRLKGRKKEIMGDRNKGPLLHADTLVLVQQRIYREACVLVIAEVAHVFGQIRRLGKDIALDRSQALYFSFLRMTALLETDIVVGGVRIKINRNEAVEDSLGAPFAQRRSRDPTTQSRGCMGVVRSMAQNGTPVLADALTA